MVMVIVCVKIYKVFFHHDLMKLACFVHMSLIVAFFFFVHFPLPLLLKPCCNIYKFGICFFHLWSSVVVISTFAQYVFRFTFSFLHLVSYICYLSTVFFMIAVPFFSYFTIPCCLIHMFC